ncbi:MAG: 2TM domain-containing protein [Bacteroidota bacterium]
MAKKKKWEDMNLSERRASFIGHFRVYLVMSVFFFVLNLVSGADNWWFYWPMLGWGIGVAIQGLSVYGPLADKEDDLKYDDYGQRQLNASPDYVEDELELKELDKRYREDDLV